MKATVLFSLLASIACVSAAPLVKRTPGPSGVLLYPYDGVSVQANAGIEVQYTRVNGASNFYTEYIDVDLLDTSSGTVYSLAKGLTSVNKETNIEAYFNIPPPASYPLNGGNTVTYTIKIQEYQIGASGPINFLAAAPSFEVNLVGGDQCAGRPQGDCGNTF